MKTFRKVWIYYVVEEVFRIIYMILCCIMPTLIFANPTLSTVEKYVFSVLFLYAPWGIEVFKLLLFIISTFYSTFYLGGWITTVSFMILWHYIIATVFRQMRLKLKCEFEADNFSAGLEAFNYILPVFGILMALTSGILKYLFIKVFLLDVFVIYLGRYRYSRLTLTIHCMVAYYCRIFLGKGPSGTFIEDMQKMHYNIGDRRNYLRLIRKLYPIWTTKF